MDGVVSVDLINFSLWGVGRSGDTAIPGQPAEESEQAPGSPPCSKNKFNITLNSFRKFL